MGASAPYTGPVPETSPAVSPAPDDRPSPKRWWIAGLLFLSTVINYVDRQTLSVLAPELRDAFQMTNTDYSRILFAFLLAYMIMQTGGGYLMDRLGPRRGLSLTVAFWSVAAMLHSGANSVMSFGVFRFLLGMGEGGNWPGGVKAISQWFPARERAFAIGLFNGGSALGGLIAPPLVTWIAITWGWRWAFVITGSLGFFWVAGWLAMPRPPQTAEPRLGAAADEAMSWKSLLGFRQVWALVGARMLTDPVWWFYVFWLPEYLRRARNFSLMEIGYFAWIPFLSADLGNLAGGWCSGHLIRRGWPAVRARTTVMCGCAATMLAGIPAVLTAETSIALALICLVTFAFSAWAANILTLPTDLFPQSVVASVTGLSGTGAALGGMCFMLLVGVLVDRFSYLPVFILAGVMPLAAAACIIVGVRRGSGGRAITASR